MAKSKISMKEVNKLTKILKKRGIVYEKENYYDGSEIRIADFNGYSFAILCNEKSRGHTQGLLEVTGYGMGREVEQLGYLNAEEVVELMEVLVV